MATERFDYYKAAALQGLLSGITFDTSSNDEITEQDLKYLNSLCNRIAFKMLDKAEDTH